ncbi:MAG TPA: hypothetical protein VGR90_04590, partial [Acidimicrobiales bacterium]|nr:hypothetical protein [Acidimicrobiales bacterium]
TQSEQGQPPSVGSGVAVVPAFIERTVALRGTAVVIYGQPGTLVELVAWVRPRPPHAAPCSLGPAGCAAIPAGTTVSDTVNLSGVGGQYLEVVTNVSALTAGSVQVTVNGITPSGYLYQLAQGAAIVAPGTQALAIGPALAANVVVPSIVQIVAVVTTGPAAYGVDLVAS